MNELQIFNYEETPVRVIEQDGEPWWVLRDVCRVLGIKNSRDTAARLDPDEKGVYQTDTLGGTQNMTIINESGLYKVILRSDKPEAKRFTRWVTHEVLPAIRKNGGYAHPGVYPPKASSLGEVVRLIEETRSMMKDQGVTPREIAITVKGICDHFGVYLPECFVKPEETTLADVYNMVDFVYSCKENGHSKPTYDDFVMYQATKKVLGV